MEMLFTYILSESGAKDDTGRGFAYITIGQCVKRVPESISEFPNILDAFFKALVYEDKNVRISVQEALSMMTTAYRHQIVNTNIREELVKILYESIVLHPVKYIAVQYASKVFESNDCDSRAILLVGSGDPKLEVKDECRIGLMFPTYSPDSTLNYKETLPDINILIQKLVKMYKTPFTWQTLNGVKYIGSFMIGSFVFTIEYLRALMIKNADPSKYIEIDALEDGQCRIDSQDTRRRVKNFLKESCSQMITDEFRFIDLYSFLIQEGLTHYNSGIFCSFDEMMNAKILFFKQLVQGAYLN